MLGSPFAAARLLLLAILFAAPDIARGQAPAPADDEEGFAPLFDGQTLTGWDGDLRLWSASNGLIIGRTTAENPIPKNTFLVWTAGWVGDFELRFSYRILSGNSGVQYRSKLHPEWRVTGYQADIEAGTNYTGIVYEEGGRGIMVSRGEVVRRSERGSNIVEDRFAKPEFLQAQIKDKDWNHYVVRAEGEVLTHTVNGVMIARLIDEQSTHAAREGILALQLHTGPPMEVHFKELRLKHLKRSAVAPDPNQATPAEAIQVPPGFAVERLYSVPREQGSWVSLVVDPKGRLIASDQYGSLYRVSGLGDGEKIAIEKLAIAIGEAQGMLFVGDDFYVCVNGGAAQGSGVYRLRDKDKDDHYEEVELLKKLDGDGEHGPHALALGPDGKIYVLAGNHTQIPPECAPNSPHRNYQEDLLLPRNPDGRGHATGVMAPGGWIARFDPAGGPWELFCAGMRNTYDVAFSPEGELFGFDSDMEWDIGTPWYRPTRVLHHTSASEYGWRYGTGKWPQTWPDSLPSVIDLGEGSPTGVVFGTQARFPRRYREALFVADWTFGRIHAVWPKPEGAGFTATSEVFVQGRPLAVTDMAIGQDGHFYFAIGGRRIQSGLYRVKAFVPDFAPIAGAESGKSARAERRALEALHGKDDVAALEKAWPALDADDRFLRWAARVVLEHRPAASWKARALAEQRPRARFEALLALARCGAAEDQPTLLARLAEIDPAALGDAELISWLRIHALAFVRLTPPTEAQKQALGKRLNPLFPTGRQLVDRDLAAMLVYLQHPAVVAKALALVEQLPSQEEQLHYIFTLRSAERGWNLPLRTAYFSWLGFAPKRFKGGMSFELFLEQIRKDAEAKLSADEKLALVDVLQPPPPPADAAAPARVRKFVKSWRVADLLPQLEAVGSGRNFESGRAAFVELQCLACHRFGDRGGSTGPTLGNVGGRFSRRDLLDALLEPSKVISDQYQNEMLVTSWDEVFVGRVVAEDATTLELKTHPLDPRSEKIAKKDIVERKPSNVSPMPNGLLDVLSAEEILDLLAYMESGGDPAAPAFKR
ncbi:MAG: DUF1080 domain-containing protein [Planctomycetes bacterium]|nr:DUF1080 domain-containing protein [Planctomycetota bacterium]